MPFCSPKPLQLHLKALLEDCDPSTVVIEMIAVLFFDTIMGQRVKESSSNTDKGGQSSPNSNNEENGKTAEVHPMAIRDISLHCNCSVISAKGKARSQPSTSIKEFMSQFINIDIILGKDSWSGLRRNGMATHSYYVRMIKAEMNKNRESKT